MGLRAGVDLEQRAIKHNPLSPFEIRRASRVQLDADKSVHLARHDLVFGGTPRSVEVGERLFLGVLDSRREDARHLNARNEGGRRRSRVQEVVVRRGVVDDDLILVSEDGDWARESGVEIVEVVSKKDLVRLRDE